MESVEFKFKVGVRVYDATGHPWTVVRADRRSGVNYYLIENFSTSMEVDESLITATQVPALQQQLLDVTDEIMILQNYT